MEHEPKPLLSAEEESFYQNVFLKKNPGMSREAFKELRDMALAKASPNTHEFFVANNVIMQEPLQGDELKEENKRNTLS